MPSLDFEKEKSDFREYYNTNHELLEDAKRSFVALINSLIRHNNEIAISKIEGRVKDREECIKKFNRKYRSSLEKESTEYIIKDHITDLIGLRIVCLYEDDIEKIKDLFSGHFDIIEITDKISAIESTEDLFGYKGLHLDLKLGEQRSNLPEYEPYCKFHFEVQIRTIVQDSWSVLDHKIKYKKSIPNKLKRRINRLAALFELADVEFKEIRNSTEEEISKEDAHEVIQEEDIIDSTQPVKPVPPSLQLNAFGLLKIAKHFFPDFEFEPHKVDGFTEEVVSMEPSITRRHFNFHMRETIAKVKLYKAHFEKQNPSDTMNPYTVIRHCLYLSNKDTYGSILTKVSRETFEAWLSEQKQLAI